MGETLLRRGESFRKLCGDGDGDGDGDEDEDEDEDEDREGVGDADLNVKHSSPIAPWWLKPQ
tara:strand:+ start:923 stop:1108 length:186 start_codon:yes stop_codon:yes gene_type:complete